MHVYLAIGHLCLKNWKQLILWGLAGPLVIFLHGTGNGSSASFSWGMFIASGAIFGVFLGSLMQVNESRKKKNQSLKTLDRDIRNLTERELHVAFSVLGIISGLLFASLLQLPLVGYLICTAIFLFFALSRNMIEKVLP
jgi:hypothetical protein